MAKTKEMEVEEDEMEEDRKEISKEKYGSAKIENRFFHPVRGILGDDKSSFSGARADPSTFNVSGSPFTNAAGKKPGRRTLRQDNPAPVGANRSDLRRPHEVASRLRNYREVVNYRTLPFSLPLSLVIAHRAAGSYVILKKTPSISSRKCHRVSFK